MFTEDVFAFDKVFSIGDLKIVSNAVSDFFIRNIKLNYIFLPKTRS